MSQATTTTTAIQEQVRRYLDAEILVNHDQTHVEVDEPLFSGLLDSLDTLRLVVFLEDTYHIQVQDGEMAPANFATVARIAEYVQGKAAA